MEELAEEYENLKISTFNKVRQINYSVHNVTIGPNSTFQENAQPKQTVKKPIKTVKIKTPVKSVKTEEPVGDLRMFLRLKEMQRIETVQEAIRNRQLKMLEEQQKIDNRYRNQWLAKQRELLHRVEQQETQIFQALEELDKNSLKQNEKRLQYYQELEERRRKKDLEIQAKEQMKRDLQCIERITKNQRDIGAVYQDILNILRVNSIDESIKGSIIEISQKLKMVTLEMDEITRKSKIGVSLNEVEKSHKLLENILDLKNKVQEIINEYNNQKLIKQQQSQEVKQASEINIPIVTPQNIKEEPKLETVAPKIDKFVSKMSFRYYSELQNFLQNHEKSYEELFKNDKLKQFKFDCKKAINIPVNAISAVSPQHLLDKYVKLSNLLSGKSVSVGDSMILATVHPQGIAFCMDLLAKKFVLQGDLMISSNPEAAFCYASIILSLWNDFPDFGKLLLAHFHKECPYLVPIYLPKSIGQMDEEYYTSLGYQYNGGVIEKQDKFLKRMTGIMRLYAAVVISKSKKSQKCNHPHGLNQGWRWLTATLNLEPRTDITATLLHVFLETVGSTMQNAYKKEFTKIIAYIINIYMPMMKSIDSGGPYTRLEVLLQEYKKMGWFPQPKGVLSSSYW